MLCEASVLYLIKQPKIMRNCIFDILEQVVEQCIHNQN